MGDLDSKCGMEALEIIEETCKWSETFYDMSMDDLKDYIDVNSGNHIVYIEYQYQQLGKDEAWFNKLCSLLNNNKLKIQREIFLKRIHGSTQSPYEIEDLQAIEDLKGDIREEIYINRIFKLDVYTPLERNKIYFIGVDVAGGYGQDNSAITVWDPYTLKTVAEFRSSYIGVKDLIKFIYILVKKHLPRSILAIERNYNGEAVLEHLRDTDIRGNIYFDNSKDPNSGLDQKLDSEGFVKIEAARRKLYGVWTGGKSRELMFGLLESYVTEHKDSFVGAYVIGDLMKLVRTKTGRIEAQVGFHDDNIMSFLMCLYLYYYGNNLSRFGFVKGVLPTNEEQNRGLNYSELYSYLSDSERETLGLDENGTGYSESYIPDMKALIEENHGLVSNNELQQTLRNESRSEDTKIIKSPSLKDLDPYSAKIYKEMQEAQRESEAFNAKLNLKYSYKNMDDEGEDYADFDAGLFDELNN